MNSEKKINVLIIPDLFPKFENDVQGIFILDYLSSTTPYCNNAVLFGRLTSSPKSHVIEQKEHYSLHRFSVSSKKVPFYLKPFYYLLWFIKGYQIGSKIDNIDIIHAHGSILSGTLSYLLSKRIKKPFIITEHQGPFSMTSENFWKRNWTRYIMQKASAVLTVSHHLKQEILNTQINPKKIIVTHNPVDTHLFKLKEFGLYKTILFVGRLDNFKGALISLKAFASIYKENKDWQFTIIGDGEDYLPITQYLDLNPELKTRVHLLGQKTKAEIAQQMQTSDFLVSPSKHESFGLVITEALSCGLPVIVGNTTAPKEFVDKENGLLVQYNNIEEIAIAMQNLIRNQSSYHSQNIRIKIVENFGFENFGKKMTDIYNSIINKY